MVVAQLVERLLPTPEVFNLNPVIAQLLNRPFTCILSVNCIEKTKMKKRSQEWPIFTNWHLFFVLFCLVASVVSTNTAKRLNQTNVKSITLMFEKMHQTK